MCTEKLVKCYTKGLTIDNLIENRTNCSLSNQELIEKGTSDLLKTQLVEKILVNPNFMRINYVSMIMAVVQKISVFFNVSFHFFHSRISCTSRCTMMKT